MSQIIKITESQLKNIVGRVINEQLGITPATTNNVAADVKTIVNNIKSADITSGNEKTVVNTIIKNSTTKQGFENLLAQFKGFTGKDLTSELRVVLQPGRDTNEIKQLVDHLKGIGITMSERKDVNNRWAGFDFVGLGGTTPATPAAGGRTPEAMKNITSTFCGVKGGKIMTGAYKDQPWSNYKTLYTVTAAEEAEAQKSCPTVQTGIVANKPKMQWTKETGNFPLMHGQVGPTIQNLQIAMGLKGDTYFGDSTEKSILVKAPEYKRQTGVTQEIYNKIVSKPVVKRDLDTNPIPLAASRPLPSTSVDVSKLAQLPNIQSIQSNVSAERRQEIAGRIEKQAITGKLIYKGGDLNPEEQQFLDAYIQALGGGDLSKSKDKGYGQKMVYNN